MKFYLHLLLLSLVVACNSQKEVTNVILIGVDGMGIDGYINAKTPNIDSLAKFGSISENMRCIVPSNSTPNWAAMLNGATPGISGILNNGWDKNSVYLEPSVKGKDGIFPTIFSVVKARESELTTAAIYSGKSFAKILEPSFIDFNRYTEREEDVADEIIETIKKSIPSFTFVRFNLPDEMGHKYDFDSKEYYNAISDIDAAIGDIINTVKELGIIDNTIFIIAGDHGGIRDGHGGYSREETTVPLIISGKSIKKGLLIEDQIYTPDVAATIAHAFGLKVPYAWVGRPVISAFEGNPDKSDDKIEIMPNAPLIEILPKLAKYSSSGGVFVDKDAEVSISSTNLKNSANSVIRYTIDGTLPTEHSTIYEQPFILKESALVIARHFINNQGASSWSARTFTLIDSKAKNGINVKYYPSRGEKWMKLPDFTKINSTESYTTFEFRADKDIIEPLIANNGNRTFALSFNGYIEIEEKDKYEFFLESDDGSKLYINDKMIVDNDGDHGIKTESGKCNLKIGRHKIRVELLNVQGDYHLELLMKTDNSLKRIVMGNMLYIDKL